MKLCKPIISAKQSVFVVVSTVLLALVSYLGTLYNPAHTRVFVLIASVFVFAGLFLLYRYTFTEFVYALSEDGFAVRKSVGEKGATVMEVELSAVERVCTAAEYKRLKKKPKKLSYNQNLSPLLEAYVICKKGEKRYALRIEPNEPFLALLLEAVDRNRKNGGEAKEKPLEREGDGSKEQKKKERKTK